MQTNTIAAPGHTGHGDHHQPGVFPGQPPAHVLPTPIGPGTTQPPDVPDTAKGSPLPHWDGVLVGVFVQRVTLNDHRDIPRPAFETVRNVYVNGAFNYGDFESVEQALAATKLLTAGSDRPAAVIWKDKFGIVHAQALLQWGAISTGWWDASPMPAAPTALHLKTGAGVVLGHPEALFVVDGDVVVGTSVPQTIPIPANGGTGWLPGGAS